MCVCVAAVLGDAEHRVAVLGGREGMPRSLGSVYGGSVTRFLGGSLRGVVSRVIDMPDVLADASGVAVSRDGCTLLAPHILRNTIREFRVADGLPGRVIGGSGIGPLRFFLPRQVYIAPDGFVFVADSGNNRVQVLTPSLDFHGFVGAVQLQLPTGVCANADVVVVSEMHAHRVSVFNRGDGTFLHRLGDGGVGRVSYPAALCFSSGDRHVAVADRSECRVSVFDVGGTFIRHVGADVLCNPCCIACSDACELVVADNKSGVLLFSVNDDLAMTFGSGFCFTSVRCVAALSLLSMVAGSSARCSSDALTRRRWPLNVVGLLLQRVWLEKWISHCRMLFARTHSQ